MRAKPWLKASRRNILLYFFIKIVLGIDLRNGSTSHTHRHIQILNLSGLTYLSSIDNLIQIAMFPFFLIFYLQEYNVLLKSPPRLQTLYE